MLSLDLWNDVTSTGPRTLFKQHNGALKYLYKHGGMVSLRQHQDTVK